MKKIIFFAILMIFMLNTPVVFAKKADRSTAVKTENKLSEEELNRLIKRVEEIRNMDKSNLSASERHELRKELKGTKEKIKKDGGYIYISGTLLLIIIILLIIF